MAEYSWLKGVGSSPTSSATPATASQKYGGVIGGPADANITPSSELDSLGSLSFNPADPVASTGDMVSELKRTTEGFWKSFFGANETDAYNRHGGQFGDIPVVGDVGRAFGNVLGTGLSAGQEIVKAGVDVTGGVLSRIPSFDDSEALKQEFEAIPDYNPIKIEAMKKLSEGQGELIGPATGHIMSEAVAAYQDAVAVETKPDLYANLFVRNASVADTLMNTFSVLGLGERIAERGFAGWTQPGSGQDQYDMIMAIGSGKQEYTPLWSFGENEQGGLDPVEQHMYDMVSSGQWTRENALDYLASHNRGWSHDKLTQILGTVLGDPINDAAMLMSLGAAAGAKVIRLRSALTGAEKALADARAGGDLFDAAGKVLIGAARDAAISDLEANVTKELVNYSKMTIRAEGSSARWNMIGKLAETERGTEIVKIIGTPYAMAQGTSVARAGKIARTIIDPFHRIGMPGSSASTALDLTSELVTKAGINAGGRMHHLALLDRLISISPDLEREISEDLGTHFGNRARSILANQHRDTIVLKGQRAIESLLTTDVGHLVEELTPHANKNILDKITEDANKWLIRVWDEDSLNNLATRFQDMYGSRHGMTIEQSQNFVRSMNKEQRSFIHQATYGHAVEMLFEGIASAKKSGLAGGINDFLDRVVLLNKNTLTTVGADGIIGRIEAADGDIAGQMQIIHDAISRYPELAYVSLDNTDFPGAVRDFLKFLERRKKRLPAQALTKEIDANPVMKELREALGESFNFGFRPEDQDILWGVERMTSEGGNYAPIGDVWVDHVSRAAGGFRPAQEVRYTMDGKPLFLKRPIDWIEAAGATLLQGVTGTMIAEAARSTFIGKVERAWRDHGITHTVASSIWKALQEEVSNADNTVSSARGFSAARAYNAKNVYELIPASARHAGFNEHELMKMILDAYAGDLRHIGASQWLSGRAKKILFQATGSNVVGQIAENLWPTAKFKLNLVFQMQERIEPVVLNIQRGVIAAMGTTPSPIDAMTDGILNRMTDLSLVRMGDALDMAEQSAAVLATTKAEALSKVPGSRLHTLAMRLATISDVKGAKRLNLLRTFRHGLGKEIKGIWESFSPGEWDKIMAHRQSTLGHLISDDDLAIHMIHDNLISTDILTDRVLKLGGVGEVDVPKAYRNAIQHGQWAVPSHVGELKPLMFDHLAFLIGQRGIENEHTLRAGLASGAIRMDDVKRVLRIHGAHPDYINRVENALTFQYEGFWEKVADAFSMSADEVKQMQTLIARTAEMRGLNSVEYLSQVWAPNIIAGDKALIGELGREVEVLRAGKVVNEPSLAKFAGGDPTAATQKTMADFIDQYTSVFAAHLDPSAKRALLLEMIGDPTTGDAGPLRAAISKGNIKLDAADIQDIWDKDADTWLSKRILGYIEGRDGTDPHTMILDPALGSQRVRALRAAHLLGQNREDLGPRRLEYELSEDLVDSIVQEYEAAPGIYYADTSRVVTSKELSDSQTAIGARKVNNPFGLKFDDDSKATLGAYQEFADEVHSQFLTITTGKNRVEVYVTKTDKYAGPDGSALLAKDLEAGKLYVNGSDVAHPFLTPEQVVEYRVTHLVFGRGADGFGSDAAGMFNAATTHAKMFDSVARSAMLSDALGPLLRNNFSKTVLPSDDMSRALININGMSRYDFGMRFQDLQTRVMGVQASVKHWTVARLTALEDRDFTELGRLLGWDDQTRLAFAEYYQYLDEIGIESGATGAYVQIDPPPGMDNQRFRSELMQHLWIDPWHMADRLIDIQPGSGNIPADIADQFERKWWGTNDAVDLKVQRNARDKATGTVYTWSHTATTRVGPGVRALPLGMQQELLSMLDEVMTRFGGVRLDHIDVKDLKSTNLSFGSEASAVTFTMDAGNDGKPTDIAIVFSNKRVNANFHNVESKAVSDNESTRLMSSFENTYVRGDAINPNGTINHSSFGTYSGNDKLVGYKYAETVFGAVHSAGKQAKIVEYLKTLFPNADLTNIVMSKSDMDAARAAGKALIPGQNYTETFRNTMAHAFSLLFDPSRAGEALLKVSDPDVMRAATQLKSIMRDGLQSPKAEALRPMKKVPVPRQSRMIDTMYLTGNTLRSVVYHEFGHVIEFDSILNLASKGQDGARKAARIRKAIDTIGSSSMREHISEYSFDSTMEAWAETFALLYENSTENVVRLRQIAEEQPEVYKGLMDLKETFEKSGRVNTLQYTPPATDGKTVAEAYAAGAIPGAKIKGRPLSTKTLDALHERVIGIGKHSEANPDISRAARMFAAWSSGALSDALKADGALTEYSDVLEALGLLPRNQAVPYNFSEALMMDLAVQSMQEKWKDAYRLQYFAQSRSMLQRSINHPMFGLYPASYMWGKIAPEMIQFISKRPFGLNTGSMLYSMRDAQKSIALQRELDPEFDKQIEGVGHNAALSFLGYMLPTIPWDINVGVPTFMRDLAKQGVANDNRRERGQPYQTVDFTKPLVDTMGKLNPYGTTIPWAARAFEAVNGNNEYDLTQGPVKGVDIGNTLGNAMTGLRSALFGGD